MVYEWDETRARRAYMIRVCTYLVTALVAVGFSAGIALALN